VYANEIDNHTNLRGKIGLTQTNGYFSGDRMQKWGYLLSSYIVAGENVKLTKWIMILCVFCMLGFENRPAAAQIPNVPTGEITLQIDPLRNRLTVFVNGVPYKKYPIALGRPDTPTPVGEWTVINKYKNWGSGFGSRWIGLNVPWGIYGIHGTNRPGSIGHDASHGCVRMFNRDVEELYKWVRPGTIVSILGHPLREPHLEPRRLAAGDSGADVLLVQSRLQSAGFYHGRVDGRFRAGTEQAMRAFEKNNGLPLDGVVSLQDYAALGLLE
jgi:hypothetical protein